MKQNYTLNNIVQYILDITCHCVKKTHPLKYVLLIAFPTLKINIILKLYQYMQNRLII